MSTLQMVGLIPGVAFVNRNAPSTPVECCIIEDQYMVSNNYKIQFEAIDKLAYGKESFYVISADGENLRYQKMEK